MSRWNKVRWSEVVEIKNGRSHKSVENANGKYPIYGSGGIMGYADDYLCEEDSVIIGRKGNINKPLYIDEKFWNVDTAFGLRGQNKRLLSKYLYYFCIKYNFEKLNTTVTIPSLTKGNLFGIEMPLPPFDIQRKITKTLDETMSLLAMHKQQLAELDNLIKSTFYDMFGDPVSNDKGWDKKLWGELFSTKTGKLDANAMCEDGIYPFFTCSKDVYRINDFAFDCEALLLAGNNATANYDVKYYSGKFNAYQRTYVITLKDRQNKYSLFRYLLELKLNQMQSDSKGTNTKYLTMGILGRMDFIIPPVSLQEQFADIVIKIEKQKALVQKAINETQHLFKCLMSEYFD